MYRLLLVTDQPGIRDMLNDQIPWTALGFAKPLCADGTREAIALLQTQAVDAVGCSLSEEEARTLGTYLDQNKPCMPVFELCDNAQRQLNLLYEARAVLNRLKADFSDEGYDEAAMLTLQQDRLIHSLLAGQVEDPAAMKRCMRLLRFRLDGDRTCILYEIDLPYGNVYITEHQHAQVRLERALRNNFFGRYEDGVYYASAVLSPRRIRLVCVPVSGMENGSREDFAAKTDRHVQDGIMMMKEYLELDMTVERTAWLEQGLRELTAHPF